MKNGEDISSVKDSENEPSSETSEVKQSKIADSSNSSKEELKADKSIHTVDSNPEKIMTQMK